MTRRLTLPYTTPSRLKYFFTDVFLSDLKSLSGKELVEKYGTHVMTDILLGGKFSAFYTGKYTSTEATQLQEFKASSNFLTSSITANVHYDSNLFNSFKNVNIYIKTQGGSQTVTSIISQDPNGKLDNVSFDYVSWMNSVTPETESLIGIGNPDTRIYLISEFIDDITKRKNIELALHLKQYNNPFNTTIISPRTMIEGKIGAAVIAEISENSNICFVPIRAIVGGNPMGRVCLVSIELEDDYIKIKRRANDYLDNSLKFSVNKNDNTQLWKMEFVNDKDFKLKNIANNLYLSSFDLKLYNASTVIDESDLYWNLSAKI